ncbi:transcriptional coactivator p15/PC4 family protein [Desulfosoma caldarium]|uniref:Transcriptional coactivator p15 (PC4) n=1 Tax=Desulfosoma caldarium TaxID=610254 RepID=A0A3N1UI86_9BACT|nr:transcriptional coactivator p15/PC4 family protein [Desulfosoma caldarium]ROQ90975.1 transcriptional coactivator p15 (PC4) [Desulfosoma caldarium]
MAENRLIHAFQKNALEEIRVALNVFRGKEYIDIRIYYKGDDGEYRPSKKGVTLSPELLPDLQDAVKKLEEALEA